MKRISLLLLFLPLFGLAQTSDDFEDGNIIGWTESSTGRWAASSTSALSGNFSLHHEYDNPDAGIDFISTSLCQLDLQAGTTTWRFQVKHGYAPSSGNNWAVFLTSDQDATSMASSFTGNGYIFGVNFNGESDDFFRLWKMTDGSVSTILSTNLNYEDSITSTGVCAVEITRSSSGLWEVFIDNDGGFDNLLSNGTISDNSIISATYLAISYEYSSAQDRKLWLDDITVTSSATSTNDNNSVIGPPSTQIAGGEIPSLAVDAASAVDVLKFAITDAGTSDGLATKISKLTFRNGSPANSANWETAIQGIVLNDGTSDIILANTSVSSSSISVDIPVGNLSIADNTTQEITMSVFLNTSGFTDDQQLLFLIDSENHSCSADNSGSVLECTFASDIISDTMTISVTGSRLSFTAWPELIGVGVSFTASVSSTDIYGNTDFDINTNVTLSNTNSGNLTSATSLTQALTGGIASWTDLQYDTEGNFSLVATDDAASLTGDTSDMITVVTYPGIIDEKFDDGDFDNNPTWTGHTDDFIIDPLYLYLQLSPISDNPDTNYLSTPVNNTQDEVEWQFYFRMDFDPSSNNYARYYLMSDNFDLTASNVNGYFIQLGEAGSIDALELFKQEGNIITSVCRAQTDGDISDNPNVRVKVKRSQTGNWTMYADYNDGGYILQPVANGFDDTFPPDVFSIGMYCAHTSASYQDDYYFDDIYVGPFIIDTIAPEIVSLKAVASNKLHIQFNEGVNAATSELWTNYSLNGTITPFDAAIFNNDLSVVELTFTDNFELAFVNTLTIINVEDLEGNAITSASGTFVLYYPETFDILINEIMTDVSPAPLDLPATDYIELYNHSDFDINLENWRLQPRTTANGIVLPDVTIPGKGYLLVIDDDDEVLFSEYENVIGIPGMYMNSEGTIVLKDNAGKIIHTITHTTDFYNDNYKADGGWSMEMIDPDNPCAGYDNWQASDDERGGTPGIENTANGTNPDDIIPELIRASIIDNQTIRLHFNEPLHPANEIKTSFFTVDYSVGNPLFVTMDSPENKSLVLSFNNTFYEDTIYTVTLQDSITDCSGNNIAEASSTRFAIPMEIDSLDIVINEVLFNPATGGSDYIEIYNNSDKTFDFKDLLIAGIDQETNELENISIIYPDGYLFFPQEFIVLTEDRNTVIDQYYTKNEYNLLEVDIPSMDDDIGTIVLMDLWEREIDKFTYNEDMHFQFLSDYNGVSLERRDYDLPTNESSNWFSAAENVGFGTPTYENSQFKTTVETTDEITIDPETFSPDNDGFDDLLNINYNLDKPGYVANVSIYDTKGRLVRRLIKSEILSQTGYFVWDGLNEANQRCNIGIYVIYVELFNEDGDVKKIKKPCVLATKLN